MDFDDHSAANFGGWIAVSILNGFSGVAAAMCFSCAIEHPTKLPKYFGAFLMIS
jgi:hypothetical protein